MLNDFSGAERVFLATGFTDLRGGIDGLAAIVQQQFELDPFANTLFLFCGRHRDRIKALYWEGGRICAAVQVSGVRFLPMAKIRNRSQSADTPAIPLAHGGVKH